MDKQKKILRRLKIEKYFSYDPTALVNKLLSQNTQDLSKRLDEIKQQKIELKKDERNSTNNKNENDRLNMILSVIDKICKFFEYNFLQGEQSDELKLLKWVKVSKNWFDMIKKCNKVQNTKSNNWQARPNQGSLINFNEQNKLLQGI